MCPNAGKKCDCADCKSRQTIDKAKEAYKWNGQLPATDNVTERLFWVVTWRKTVEYLSCRVFEGDKWIVNRDGGPMSGVYATMGVNLFDTEAEAQSKLVTILESEKTKLQAWIDAVNARVELLRGTINT